MWPWLWILGRQDTQVRLFTCWQIFNIKWYGSVIFPFVVTRGHGLRTSGEIWCVPKRWPPGRFSSRHPPSDISPHVFFVRRGKPVSPWIGLKTSEGKSVCFRWLPRHRSLVLCWYTTHSHISYTCFSALHVLLHFTVLLFFQKYSNLCSKVKN